VTDAICNVRQDFEENILNLGMILARLEWFSQFFTCCSKRTMQKLKTMKERT